LIKYITKVCKYPIIKVVHLLSVQFGVLFVDELLIWKGKQFD